MNKTQTPGINELLSLFAETLTPADVLSAKLISQFSNSITSERLRLNMSQKQFADYINVYIGNENENEQLKDFSIVTFKHRYKNKDLGTIGIIGPTRMDYSKVISVMKYISKKLSGE